MLLILILFATNVQAEFIIQEPSIIISLAAGSNITKNITFRYADPKTRQLPFAIKTIILPDSEGIIVAYSNITPTIFTNKDYTIQIFISTSFYLMPQKYVIYTLFSESGKNPPKQDNGKTIIIIPPKPPDDDEDDDEPNIPDDNKDTEPDEDVEPPDNDEESKEQNNCILDFKNPFSRRVNDIIAIILGVIIIFMIYLLKKKAKRGNKNEEENK